MPAEARYFEGLKQTGRRSAMGVAAEIHAETNKISGAAGIAVAESSACLID
jgi:pectate lyase